MKYIIIALALGMMGCKNQNIQPTEKSFEDLLKTRDARMVCAGIKVGKTGDRDSLDRFVKECWDEVR